MICGDKVLAPWDPEGEKYGPGVVIEGQEKRHAEGKNLIKIKGGSWEDKGTDNWVSCYVYMYVHI